jgi:hypothetical protein
MNGKALIDSREATMLAFTLDENILTDSKKIVN